MSSKTSKLHHILELSTEEKENFINSFDTIFSDCDGVLWLMLGAISNTGTPVNLLKTAGKEYKFISNNSMRTDDEYIQKLRSIGVKNIKKSDIVHPVKTIIRYLKKKNITKPIFTLADDVFDNALRNAGFNLIGMEIKKVDNVQQFSNDLLVTEEAGAVIFDVDCNMNFSKLIKAQLYLQQPDCELIVGASDDLMALKEHLTVLGPGGFVKMLSSATGKKPIILGKPGMLLGDFLLENYNITDRKRVLFIGDALAQDIEFGNKCGFQTLLVLSGATNKQSAINAPPSQQPTYYADSLADFIKFFKDMYV